MLLHRTRTTKPTRFLQVVALCMLVFVTACSRQMRHKVLTFFFTGVPPLEEPEQSKGSADKTAAPVMPAKEKFVPPKLYNHPHYASGSCYKCHAVSPSFRMLGQKNFGSTPFRKGGGSPGKILAPLDALCIRCHLDKSRVMVESHALWLHTPAAKGECCACHDAHQSTHPYILTKEVQEICGGCHHQNPVMQRGDHQDPARCLECHNPHLGINRHLLKKEYQERSKTDEADRAPR